MTLVVVVVVVVTKGKENGCIVNCCHPRPRTKEPWISLCPGYRVYLNFGCTPVMPAMLLLQEVIVSKHACE